MSNAGHFSDAVDFQRQSDDFARWLSQQADVTVSPKIQIQDLRHQGSGRGVGKLFTIHCVFFCNCYHIDFLVKLLFLIDHFSRQL